ncbi:hypothetical protein Pla123a_31380 [Posidoniimonas polymericola]|uniref:Alpha-L-rhamnosidase six-hairpin glycosidase domain-containing protein n=1 Tax=Posidoniimonas polymericola TaxID=2528002 RepID=A0A5C5YLJ9_9BACT|nr:hypothetical protein [Posidoniimonas polymericola]TWT75628.1 hypothetical protein Pla123a_31380 [Posidoniimonas polymericola]
MRITPLLPAVMFALWVAPSCLAGPAPEDVIPSLDELGSEWLDPAEVVHMPSLHNFHEMAACEPTLLGVNYNPGGRLFAAKLVSHRLEYDTLPRVELRINGKARPAQSCRWFPHQAVRRAVIDGVEIETTVRLVFEAPGILYRVRLANPGQRTTELSVEITAPGAAVGAGQPIVYQSSEPRMRVEHRFARAPDRLTVTDATTAAAWRVELAAGEARTLELVMAHSPLDSAADSTRASEWANDFAGFWDAVQRRWAERWLQAFTPGNTHFSGHAPLLVTDDPAIRQIYYRSVLTLLVLHRTNLAMSDRVFITSGERERGFVFYWDTSMWSKLFALLEPAAMKEQLKLFLEADPHGGFVYNMDTGKQGPGWYAANDMTMFRLANSYLAVTGDEEFLHEQVADRTVIDHLEKLAIGWRKLRRDPSVALADYGENENLLECAPRYIHRVPSFNAANVWMMRVVADYREQSGQHERASQLRGWADEVAAAVNDLYKPGDGVWHALHRDGERVELRHCYDFVCVGRFMTDDLPPQTKREMVDFVERELLAHHWMRAMSQRDEAAQISDRPDHGPMGAFDAWPALTANTMCRLGAWDEAVSFIRSTSTVLNEGVYGQAHEFYGPDRNQPDAPLRIAARGWCLRECVGGGAFAEWVIESLFGYTPELGRDLQLLAPQQPRGFNGRLYNVGFHGRSVDLVSDASGVRTLPAD